MKFSAPVLMLTALVVASGASCSSSSSDSTGTATGPVGGQVAGAADSHCAGHPDGVSDPAACLTPDTSNGSAGAADAAGGATGGNTPGTSGGATGTPDCNLAHDASYGDTLYNASGDDDDCKYQVSWTSTPIRKGQHVAFTVTATTKAGAALQTISAQKLGATALSRVEPYIPCDPTHFPPAADLRAPITETMPGVFSVGPIVFDKSGRWVVRFHFYEECIDSDTSPHGHVAFFVDVP